MVSSSAVVGRAPLSVNGVTPPGSGGRSYRRLALGCGVSLRPHWSLRPATTFKTTPANRSLSDGHHTGASFCVDGTVAGQRHCSPWHGATAIRSNLLPGWD